MALLSAVIKSCQKWLCGFPVGNLWSFNFRTFSFLLFLTPCVYSTCYRFDQRGICKVGLCGSCDSSSTCFSQLKSPFSNMAFKLPIISSLKDSLKLHTANLPKFQWSELSDKDEIGRGTYGSVFVATHGSGTVSEKVVVKKLITSTPKFVVDVKLFRGE